MQSISPFLWFNDNAEEAANFYISVFKNSSINAMNRWGKGGPATEGSVMVASINLDGQTFTLLNGGPQFRFTEAVSFVISCKDQEEVDFYWNALSGGGGQESMCGWLKDKFGLSWQVVPEALPRLMSSGKPAVTQALMGMQKIDIAALEQAAQG